MKGLFVDIVEITLPISVCVILLLMCSPLLKRSYVAKWRYFMWLFVAVRLILPFKMRANAPIQMSVPGDITQNSVTETVLGYDISVLDMLTAVWMLGMFAVLAIQIFSYFSFNRLTKRWSCDVTDKRVKDIFKSMTNDSKMRLEIKSCKAVSSPMIFGIIKPVLLMPDMNFSDDELRVILRHELVHLKRHDIWFKLLLMTARTIHWFNPVVYLMFKAANKDMEFACDTEVVADENTAFRANYCEAIMRLVHNGRGRTAELSTCLFISKKTIMERFKNILDEKIKRNGIVAFCAAALAVVVSGGVITFATEHAAEEIEQVLRIEERIDNVPAANPTEQPTEVVVNTETPVSAEEITEHIQPPGVSVQQALPPQKHTASAQTHSETSAEAVENIEMGNERSDVYEKIGEPDSVSSDGSRETYNLEDGNTAILKYDGEVLDTGYIVVN